MSQPRISAYTFDAPDGYEHETITVEATGRLHGGRFDPRADVWAIRKRGWCLSREGAWEYEPLPSSRDDDWLRDHRWPLAEALRAAADALARDNASRVAGR